MAIQISCPCPVRFDKESGKYVPCGHRFSVDERLAGRQVACPKCGGAVGVPKGAAPASGKAASSAPGKGPSPPQPDESDPFELTPQAPSAHVAAAPPVDPRPASEEDDDATFVAPVRGVVGACPHCGASWPSADALMCSKCAYHRKLHPRFQELAQASDEEDMPGWERWFREQLAMGESSHTVSIWVRAVAVVLFLVSLAVLSIAFGSWGRIVALLFAAVVIGLIVVAVRAGWRGDLPSAVLAGGRAFGWRALAWPMRPLNAVNLRGTPTRDIDVANLDNAKEIEALDLESTLVTDMALPHLAKMRKLQFLVLRGAKVTDRGETLLQRALPHTWIWR